VPTFFASSAALLFAFLPCARGQTTYGVTEVPVTLSGPIAPPVNLTDNGQIAFNDGGQAFVWSPAGLRSLSLLPGFQNAEVFKVEDDGRAFGNCSNPGPIGHASPSVPVTWTADGVVHRLRHAAWFDTGAAVDANGLGQILGFETIHASLTIDQPVLWWHKVETFLPVPGVVTQCRSNSINDHGMIVGSAIPTGSFIASPVVWSSPSAAFFPDLPPGYIGGELQSVNNAGQAVGYVSTWTTYQSVWYDENGLRPLDNPPGYQQCFLRTINRSGQAVGHAFSHDARKSGIVLIGGRVQLIGDLLDPVTGSGWSIPFIWGLNNPGQMAALGQRTVPPFNSAILLLDPLP
jgi:hypothetical protein